VLDAMQTTPAFVYLVPIVMLFSVGNVAGVLATIIFALPPIIRLTSLGIRQVHPELVEAAQAFGATNWQVLIRVQVPLAMPTILAGLNQTIMMALSMVVIAALIGAGGLGSPVILGLEHPGYRPGRHRWAEHCVDGHRAGPDYPVHGAKKITAPVEKANNHIVK
jgi:glycine betaine/proline transport system permease protein